MILTYSSRETPSPVDHSKLEELASEFICTGLAFFVLLIVRMVHFIRLFSIAWEIHLVENWRKIHITGKSKLDMYP